jgi:hypothetical protein
MISGFPAMRWMLRIEANPRQPCPILRRTEFGQPVRGKKRRETELGIKIPPL